MLRNSFSAGLSSPRTVFRRSSAPETFLRRVPRRSEDAGGLTGIDRKFVIEISQRERVAIELDPQLSAFEDVAVLIAEDRQQQLRLKRRFLGPPVDIEKARRR